MSSLLLPAHCLLFSHNGVRTGIPAACGQLVSMARQFSLAAALSGSLVVETPLLQPDRTHAAARKNNNTVTATPRALLVSRGLMNTEALVSYC